MGHTHKFGHKHGESLLSIDAYAYASNLIHLNAGVKTGWSLFFLVFGLAADSLWVSLTLFLTMLLVSVFWGNLSLSAYLGLLKIPLFFIAMGSLAVLLDITKAPAGEYGVSLFICYLSATRTSIYQTILLVVRSLGAISCLYMLILSTPAFEIIRVLRRLHVPALVCELMNMVYRFIFILMDVQQRMTVSAKSRLGFDSLRGAYDTFGHMIGNLLVLSLRRSNAYYDAMESRCYDGELLFLTENKPIRPAHVLCPVLLAGLLCTLLLI